MIRRKVIALIVIMMMSLVPLPIGQGQIIDKGRYSIEEVDGWEKIITETITVAVPSDSTIPMFIWWYNNDNSILYVAKYEGLAEAWLFTSEQFSHAKLFVDNKGFTYEFIVRANSHGWMETSGFVLKKINEASNILHPFFFSFSQGNWELTPIEEIRAEDGTLVGLAFAFILTDSKNSSFEFAEGNIIIRNKLFFDPVMMQVEKNEVILSKAELKSDIIISNWKWNYDAFFGTLGELSYELPEIVPRLVLSSTLNIRSVDGREVIDVMNEERDGITSVSSQTSLEVRIRVGDRTIVVGRTDEEGEIVTMNGLPKLEMLTRGRTMSGFFSFNPSATVVYKGQSNMKFVDVEGVFWAARGLKTFIVYPYFGGGTLMHDPSVGVSSPELESEAPKYIFKSPIASMDIVPPPQTIVPIEMVPIFELAVSAIIFVMIVAAVIVINKKTKIEVLDGLDYH
jgi:hypothetical protein